VLLTFEHFESGAPSLAVRIVANREVVRRGHNLEVRCDVTGDPNVLVSWRRSQVNVHLEKKLFPKLLDDNQFEISESPTFDRITAASAVTVASCSAQLEHSKTSPSPLH
jgi:hypothetical protein